jgi:hypothetical protein
MFIIYTRITDRHIIPGELSHFCTQLQVFFCKRGVFHVPRLFAKPAVKLKLASQAANNKYGHRLVAIFAYHF